MYDSQEEAEYQETMNKMAALGTAITNTEVAFRNGSKSTPTEAAVPLKDEDVASGKLNAAFLEVSSGPAPNPGPSTITQR